MTYMYESIRELEMTMGSLSKGPLSASSILAYDNANEFCRDHVEFINKFNWGFRMTPKPLGGALANLVEAQHLIRCLARRDIGLTAIKSVSLFASIPIWMAGSDQQKNFIKSKVGQNQELALALTEENVGSDLLSSKFIGQRMPDGQFNLSGTKWLINNAQISQAKIILVRTHDIAGPRSLSLFLVPNDFLNKDNFQLQNKIPLAVTKTMNVGSFEVRDLKIPEAYLIGKLHHGLDLTLKTLQISRSLVATLSLGLLETSLRLITQYFLNKNMYGEPLIEIPKVRESLAMLYSRFCVLDCFSLLTAKVFHQQPAALGFYSAVSKYAVQLQMDQMMVDLVNLLGARSFLSESPEFGLIQKFWRDSKLLGIFDGHYSINLQIISSMLGGLLKEGNALSSDAFARLLFEKLTDEPWNFDQLKAFSQETLGPLKIFNDFYNENDQKRIEKIREQSDRVLALDSRHPYRLRVADELAHLLVRGNFEFYASNVADDDRGIWSSMSRFLGSIDERSPIESEDTNFILRELLTRVQEGLAFGVCKYKLSI